MQSANLFFLKIPFSSYFLISRYVYEPLSSHCSIFFTLKWGQDINKLQACGPALIETDPDSNIMLSVHCWWPYMYGHSKEEVYKEFEETYNMELPLVVGEFANQWEETTQGQIPYKEIMECCAKYEIGYLIWSWGPGNNPQSFLNMTTDSTFNTLQPWAKEMIFDSDYALNKLSVIPESMRSGLPAQKPANPLPAGNLALGKDVVSSSIEGTGYEALKATDGDITSRWASNSNSPTDWIYVDLGSEKDINKVLINWENAYAAQYQVQVSNDALTWTDVYRTYNGTGGLEEITLDKKCTARYVRIYCTQKFYYSWGYSIFEIGVYGDESKNYPVIKDPVAVFDKNVKKQVSPSFVVDSKDNKLVSITNGDYSLINGKDFTFPIPGKIEEILLGDVNGDGLVNISDYTILKKYINGDNITINKLNSDFNGDEKINFLDLIALKSHL